MLSETFWASTLSPDLSLQAATQLGCNGGKVFLVSPPPLGEAWPGCTCKKNNMSFESKSVYRMLTVEHRSGYISTCKHVVKQSVLPQLVAHETGMHCTAVFLPQLLQPPFRIPCLWRLVPLKALSSPEFRLGAEMARRIELVATELGCSYVPLYEARKRHRQQVLSNSFLEATSHFPSILLTLLTIVEHLLPTPGLCGILGRWTEGSNYSEQPTLHLVKGRSAGTWDFSGLHIASPSLERQLWILFWMAANLWVALLDIEDYSLSLDFVRC